MLKNFSLLSVKIISVFTLSLLLGLYSGRFFERYIFKYGIVESFSRSEAKSLIGKQVIGVCNGDSEKPNPVGNVTGYDGTHFGEIRVNVKWVQSEFNYVGYPKSYFKKCIKEVK